MQYQHSQTHIKIQTLHNLGKMDE